MRTKNFAEACHRRINSIFHCAYPTLGLFLQILEDEESVVHADLVRIDERLERRLLNLLRNSHSQVLVQYTTTVLT